MELKQHGTDALKKNCLSGDNAFLEARSIVFCLFLKQKFHAQEFALYSLHGGESNADCAR